MPTILILTLGRIAPSEVFLSFSLEEKRSAPDIFSRCLFISRVYFETSSVMVSFYGYEI